MKVKLGNITNSLDAVRVIVSAKMPCTKSYALAKLVKAMDAELAAFEEVKNNAILKFSSDGNKVDDDKIELFVAEVNELLKVDIELPDVSLSAQDLEDSKVEISASDILRLDWLLNPISTDAKEEALVGELV